MNNLFETKVSVEKMQEDGLTKKVQEIYLVDAITFGEAETRIIEEIAPYSDGEVFVSGIKRTRYNEIFKNFERGERWYRVKVTLVTLDENSGKEKKSKISTLVKADNTQEAEERLHQCMKGSMIDYEVCDISETPILDYYEYKS